jgi:hypothetical protein
MKAFSIAPITGVLKAMRGAGKPLALQDTTAMTAVPAVPARLVTGGLLVLDCRATDMSQCA